ncbi:MAG: glycosyltransferase family 4 protein [Rikenellaceae bacterium]
MRVLLVHNNYGAHSGEESVVDLMAKMYASLGYEVEQYRKSTEAIQHNFKGKISAFVKGIFPKMNVKEFADVFDKFKPDVVHVHNLYPFIGPAILKYCKQNGSKVIMTIHNYRLMCPTGLFMRNSRPCERCLEKGDEWSCVKYNCEHSLLKSLGYALRNRVARRNRYYLDNIDKYCCLTHFQREKLIEAGFDAKKIEVIPNSCSNQEANLSTEIGDYIGYCGRLSEEKGIDMIFEVARRNPNITFKFAGAARTDMGDIPDNCVLLGHMSGEEFKDFIRNARFLVMASRWYEGFPMAILDAISFGKSVVVPRHGGFTEIVENDKNPIGLLFKPNETDDLELKVVSLWNNMLDIAIFSSNTTLAVETKFSSDVIKERWKRVIETY